MKYRRHKIEIKINDETKIIFNKYFRYRRYCYNRASYVWEMLYRAHKENPKQYKRPNFFRVRDFIKARFLQDWELDKTSDDFCSQQINDTAIEDIARGYNLFFKKAVVNPPKHKPDWKREDSFRFNERNGNTIRIRDGFLMLPNIKYKIKLTENIRYDGIVKECTIKRQADKYYATFSIAIKDGYERKNVIYYKKQLRVNNLHSVRTVGIDLGISNMITIASKEYNEYLIFNDLYDKLKPYIKKVDYYHSILNKKICNSKNHKIVKLKMEKIHRRIVNIRTDYLHKLSTFIVRKYKYICIEKIKVRNWIKDLSRQARKKLNYLGINIFINMLKYKAPIYNSIIIEADKYYPSSQLCSNCGYHLNKEERISLDDRIFHCPECNNSIDRDKNAALNLEKYIEIYYMATAS